MKKILIVFIITLSVMFLFPIGTTYASKEMVDDSWYFTVRYEQEGRLVLFPITVYGYNSVDYIFNSSTRNYELGKKNIGGVIYNVLANAYPFGQGISGAENKWYKDGSLQETWRYSVDGSSQIHDPDDLPYGYKHTTNKYLYFDYSHDLKGSVYWLGNGTIPTTKTLKFDTDIIF